MSRTGRDDRPDTSSLEIRRLLPAPIDEVFRWWTEPTLMREWMTPVGSCEIDNDLRIGGRLHVVMRGDGMVIEHDGEYLELDPPRRLVFTWSSIYTGPGISIVTVELEADGPGATRLRLLHTNLSDEAARSHRGGWQGRFDRLVGRLTNVRAG